MPRKSVFLKVSTTSKVKAKTKIEINTANCLISRPKDFPINADGDQLISIIIFQSIIKSILK